MKKLNPELAPIPKYRAVFEPDSSDGFDTEEFMFPTMLVTSARAASPSEFSNCTRHEVFPGLGAVGGIPTLRSEEESESWSIDFVRSLYGCGFGFNAFSWERLGQLSEELHGGSRRYEMGEEEGALRPFRHSASKWGGVQLTESEISNFIYDDPDKTGELSRHFSRIYQKAEEGFFMIERGWYWRFYVNKTEETCEYYYEDLNYSVRLGSHSVILMAGESPRAFSCQGVDRLIPLFDDDDEGIRWLIEVAAENPKFGEVVTLSS